MDITRFVIFGVYGAVFAYLLYRLSRKNPMKDEYDKLYNDILTSKKYKVKGQFEQDD